MPGLWLLGFACVLPAFCVECEGQACEADDAGFVQWNGRDRREARRHGREERREDRRHRRGYHHYPSPPPPPPRKPNIFVIIVDDLGFNQVGYRARHTDNFDVHTPFIDDLAQKGIKMERFYATPWCAPSRAALQSGRLDALNPDVSNNIWDWDANATGETLDGEPFTTPYVGGIQPGTITLGEKFSELGYVTHLNGKWGIGGGAFANTPMGMGYSSFMGWFGDSMESCDGAEPGFAVGGAGPLLDNLPGFWRQDAKATFLSPWCSTLENLNQLDEEELFVACRSFKAELDDVADEVIRRRSREIIVQHNYHEAPLFLVHAFQLMHLPMQYPRRFAPEVSNASEPLNTDLRAATYGALTYVDWVIGDLVEAFKEQDQYDNTIIFFTSDNGGAIYAGTANNNYPLRGGKFNNFEGGQRVNAFFSGGWVESALKHKSLSPFHSDTVMAINDVPETLLQMIGANTSMGHEPGPLTGVPLWHKILHGKQWPRAISYSRYMQLNVTEDITGLTKYWFLGTRKIICDGNWSANYPNNSEFIPDFAYVYVQPCGTSYCYFNLYDQSSEQEGIDISLEEEARLTKEVREAWNDNIILTSRVTGLNTSNAYPFQVALWTHYGASGPFLTRKAEVLSVTAQCWCDWIDDHVPAENVTHVIFNLYLGARCTDDEGALWVAGALPCNGSLKLTQAPIPFSLEEDLWKAIGFETDNFSNLSTAQWDFGPVNDSLPLPLLIWNLPIIQGLQHMNARLGFQNWANIAKYPFNLAIRDHCPTFNIFTAPMPKTQVTYWLLSGGVFNNPTDPTSAGKLNETLEYLGTPIPDDGKVRGCFLVSPREAVCPSLDNFPPQVDASDVPITSIIKCLENCILFDPYPFA